MNNTTITEKFTPGPWQFLFGQAPASVEQVTVPPDINEYDRNGWRSKTISIGGSDGNCFADIKAYTTEGFLQDFNEWEANAKLIAAAPDLFAACKEFVRKVEAGEAKSSASYEQMKAAIKKATE